MLKLKIRSPFRRRKTTDTKASDNTSKTSKVDSDSGDDLWLDSVQSEEFEFQLSTAMKPGSRLPSLTFGAGVPALEGYEFVHSQMPTIQWTAAIKKFIEYAAIGCGSDVKISLKRRKLAVVTAHNPRFPEDSELSGLTKTEQKMRIETWFLERDIYNEVVAETSIALSSLYTILWLQCDPILQKKIRNHPRILKVHEARDTIGLLSIIDSIRETRIQRQASTRQRLGHERKPSQKSSAPRS